MTAVNETAQEALNRLITMAVDGLEGAAAFAEAEIPSVIEQLLMWKMLESMISTFVPTALFLAILFGYARMVLKIQRAKVSKDNDGMSPYEVNLWWSRHDMSGLGYVVVLGGAMASALLFLATVFSVNLDWLYILVAPKVYLLEYASHLVK